MSQSPQSLTRVNVTLPTQLVEDLEASVGSRGKSAFIAQAVRQMLEQLRRDTLARELEEGYAARAEEARDVSGDFRHADLEGWDARY